MTQEKEEEKKRTRFAPTRMTPAKDETIRKRRLRVPVEQDKNVN